ncbi:Gfo/Idh/MocA family oxidoreductase [Clostridium sp. YIM B02515]|uniref:Gfo/Idh/MocA family oxidoreductase n=1 Tax=Clostridium rhizosphaerae TaxID=2803861 RepID=A0ABS1TA72_9CLOT|nr:Gfo/Idh/MocA family oxidoreductase [Clostridium rhizosphaerae]MBL4936249.1 Gfo/Idh/MocA family oxidoreductase [Clostridium rhizosphaerae]
MCEKIRWGIIAPGGIANAFADGLQVLEEAEITAVASRSIERAESFAAKYKVSKIYDSYKSLAEDDNIDAVYIATPHSFHKETAIMCLEKGKAVLCEKPIGINENEMLEMIKCAKENKVFLMEAMWTRFLPVINEVKQYIEKGLIGDICLVKANFGFKGDSNPEKRILNPKLAGGALLDVGIYPLTFADLVYNKEASEIKSMMSYTETGVDQDSTIILDYGSGKRAEVSISIKDYIPHEGLIIGTKGNIKLDRFFMPTSAVIEIEGEEPREIKIPFLKNGYEYEAMEVMSCIREGRLESSIMPHEKSLRLLRTMDRIRKQWNFKYPGEN